MAQRGADEDLEADLRGHRVTGQTHDGGAGALIVATDGTHAHDVAGPGGDAIETDGTEGAEDLADGVAAAVRDATGRQDEVGAH